MQHTHTHTHTQQLCTRSSLDTVAEGGNTEVRGKGRGRRGLKEELAYLVPSEGLHDHEVVLQQPQGTTKGRGVQCLANPSSGRNAKASSSSPLRPQPSLRITKQPSPPPPRESASLLGSLCSLRPGTSEPQTL